MKTTINELRELIREEIKASQANAMSLEEINAIRKQWGYRPFKHLNIHGRRQQTQFINDAAKHDEDPWNPGQDVATGPDGMVLAKDLFNRRYKPSR